MTTVNDREVIEAMVQDYFDCLHQANVNKLAGLFHEDCVLKAPKLRRTQPEWLHAVANRPVPQELGAAYGYRLVSIDLLGEQAMVKIECPLLGHNYIDFLGFLKEEDKWLIVNKMYADAPSTSDCNE